LNVVAGLYGLYLCAFGFQEVHSDRDAEIYLCPEDCRKVIASLRTALART
jgi:hypothetical protein